MSTDQIVALIRQMLPLLGGIMLTLGVSSATETAWVNFAMEIAGPVTIAGSAIWTGFANTRASIMASAAKPAAPGVPSPQIVLPQQEAKLAASLPANVTSKS